MRKLVLQATILAAIVLGCILLCSPARAEPAAADSVTFMNWSKRLSVSARLHRGFAESGQVSGAYTSDWRLGLTFQYMLTDVLPTSSLYPLALVGTLDLSVPERHPGGYFGIETVIRKPK